jgi:predicted Fe-Mo cluster-binding NifX family protein
MKIAVSATGKGLDSQMDARFGRCPNFVIAEAEGMKIKGSSDLENTAMAQAGGAGITAAELVGNQKVDAVIAGSIGPRAFSVLSQLDIDMYAGRPGTVRENIEALLQGRLEKLSAPSGPMGFGDSGKGMGAGKGRGQGRR